MKEKPNHPVPKKKLLYARQELSPVSGATSLRLSGIYTSADPDRTVVKLMVDTIWQDGSGYQMLLDSRRQIYDTFYEEEYHSFDMWRIEELYERTDVTIPENAVPDHTVPCSVLDGQQDSAVIEPGVYDVFVVNPSEDPYLPGETEIYVAQGEMSHLNDFYFAAGYTYVFHCVKDEKNGDNVLFTMPCDLRLSKLVSPVSGCRLDDIEVGIEIENNGSEVYEEDISVFYTIEGTTDTVKGTVPGGLLPGATGTYVFEETTPIAEGESVVVHAGIFPGAKEGLQGNNYASRSVVRHEPVDLPHTFDLENGEMMSSATHAWEWDTAGFLVSQADDSPLLSMCFDMEAGKTYRIAYEYMAGMDIYIIQYPGAYSIGFGKTSEPWEDWKTVLHDSNAMMTDFALNEVVLNVEESGTYAFYFRTHPCKAGTGNFKVKNISFAEVLGYDIRLTEFVTGLPRLMPEDQINGTFTAGVTMENRGSVAIEKAVVTILAGEEEVGKREIPFAENDSVKTESVEFVLSGLKDGDKTKLTAKVEIAGHEDEDANPDNELYADIEVSRDVMAYDNATEGMYVDDHALGAQSSIGCGLPFFLSQKDTLTAVSLGWSEVPTDMDIRIAIYKWDAGNQELGDLLFETVARRGKEAGQRMYEFPALLLEAGAYMISAEQTGSDFYGLVSDLSEEGFLYITTNYPITLDKDKGFPTIRAVFGQDGEPMAKDIVVKEISEPGERGLFSANEPIVVRLVNQGYEAATVPVSIIVDKTLIETRNVEIGGYGRVEVSVNADLSESDKNYLIKAYASLADDTDRTNDTCTKIVYSIALADPYTMDFENSEDFSVSGFNPSWTPVDRDGAPTVGFSGITFPNDGEAFAYIVFNPWLVSPSPSEETLATLAPHGGQRFGASFCSSSKENDDWLISPKLLLPSQGAKMTFYVKSYTDEYGLEKYNVLISGTDDNPESFVTIGSVREARSDAWEKVEVDLSEYAGKSVHLAIQCVSEDVFIFMLDDIVVSKPAGNQTHSLSGCLLLYPNPAKEMITIRSAGEFIRQVSIYNMAGASIYDSPSNLDTDQFRFHTGDLGPGVYFARVRSAYGVEVIKFVIR